jgi:tRNA (guanosine-2'-O-)-methyltransferase
MTPERFDKLRRMLLRRQPDLTVFMDSVNKPHNVSAILRTADAVAIHEIHAVSDSGAMRRYHMIAGGAKRWVGVALHRSAEAAIAALRAGGWRLVAAHAGAASRDFRSVDYTQKTALMFGAELVGLAPAALDAADVHVSIPMLGLGASINVSVAAGVILFEAQRQRMAAGLYDHSRLSVVEFERTLFEWSYPEIAERCRQLGRRYPALDAEGMMTVNPLVALPER